MIIITGAAGFIGSVLVGELNRRGHSDLILVDLFGRSDRANNLAGKSFAQQVDRAELSSFLANSAEQLAGGSLSIECIYHIGARTDTAELDTAIFDELNVEPSKQLWQFSVRHQIPFVYASSAATYGGGEHGYSDAHATVSELEPLNPYGVSKQTFDEWVLAQAKQPPFWAGLKFFNVYGPNEYHKGRMASVMLHAYRQIQSTGAMRLFRSHRADIADGQQQRDFVYVRDVVDVLLWLGKEQLTSGIYNLGTGKAGSFNALATTVFTALDRSPDISYIDTPADIRDTYQYYTQADMSKLRAAGYTKEFTTLEAGVSEYVKAFLKTDAYL